MEIKHGSTDKSLDIILRKTSDNTELTGVAYTSASAYYWRQGGTPTSITLSALTNINDAHSDGGWKEADATNMPGSYRLDVPDAAFASSADWVEINVKVATAYVWKERFQLVGNTSADNNALLTNGSYGLAQLVRSTTPGNTLGVNASGQVVISATANNAITASSLATDCITSGQLSATAISEIQSGLATSSALTSVAGDVTSILDDTGTSGVVVASIAASAITATSIASNAITSAKIATDAITSAQFAQTAADKVWSTTSRSITGLTAAALSDFFDTSSGTNYAAAVSGSVVKEIADNAAVGSLTAASIADAVWDEATSGHTTAGTYGKAVADIKSDTTAILDDTGTSGVIVVTNNDKTGYGLADGAITAAKIGSDAITAAKVAADVSAEIADAVWDEARAGHVSAGTFGEGVASVQGNVTGNVAGSTASVTAGVTVTTNNDKTGYRLSATGVDDVWDEARSGHATVGTFGEGVSSVQGNVTGSIGSLAAQAKADVNAEADTALADINLDHLVKIAVDTDFPTTVHLNSVIGNLVDNGTSASFDRTTDSLEALRDRGDAAWITATGFATSAALSTVSGKIDTIDDFLDTEIAAIQTAVTTTIPATLTTLDGKIDTIDNFVDTEMAAVKAVTDKLDTALELDSTVYRFTTNALENAPTGGGGSSDWSAGEKEQIRHRLGIDGTATAPSATPSLSSASAVSAVKSVVDSILDDTGTAGVIVATVNDKTGYGLASGAVNTTSLADGTLTAAKIASDAITAAKVAADVTTEIQSGLATASALTTVGTNVSTLLTRVPDTISLANINAQADTALADYDAPTKSEMDAAFTEIKGSTWNISTDTLEAIRDRGDAAWTTATGFSTFNPASQTVTLADGSLTAAKIASNAITSAKVDATAANKIADHTIRRNLSNVEASSDGDTKDFQSLLGAAAKGVNKVSESSTTVTIYESDGTTTLGTQTLTLDANALPIIGVTTN